MHLCLKDKSTSNISVCVSSAFLEQANKLPAEETSCIANISQLTRESGSGLGDWLASYDLSPNFCLRPTFCPNVSERSFHWNCHGCQTFLNEVGGRGILHSRRSGLRSFRPIHLCPILLQIQIVRGRGGGSLRTREARMQLNICHQQIVIVHSQMTLDRSSTTTKN